MITCFARFERITNFLYSKQSLDVMNERFAVARWQLRIITWSAFAVLTWITEWWISAGPGVPLYWLKAEVLEGPSETSWVRFARRGCADEIRRIIQGPSSRIPQQSDAAQRSSGWGRPDRSSLYTLCRSSIQIHVRTWALLIVVAPLDQIACCL